MRVEGHGVDTYGTGDRKERRSETMGLSVSLFAEHKPVVLRQRASNCLGSQQRHCLRTGAISVNEG